VEEAFADVLDPRRPLLGLRLRNENLRRLCRSILCRIFDVDRADFETRLVGIVAVRKRNAPQIVIQHWSRTDLQTEYSRPLWFDQEGSYVSPSSRQEKTSKFHS
jgi:hypothetical protein